MVDDLAEEELGKCLDVVGEAWSSGVDLGEYCRQLVSYYHGLLLAQVGQPDPALFIDLNDTDRFTLSGIRYAIGVWNKASRDVHGCQIPQIELECAVVDCLDYGISSQAGDF